MKYNKQKVLERLNLLLTRNYDAEQGYIEAGMHVSDGQLREWFNYNAAMRKKFGHEIKAQITAFGEEPDKGTSIAGELHHFWMNLKSYFTDENAMAMLEECRRGEEKAIEDYQEVIDEVNVPPAIQSMAQRHVSDIKARLDSIEAMKELYDTAEVA